MNHAGCAYPFFVLKSSNVLTSVYNIYKVTTIWFQNAKQRITIKINKYSEPIDVFFIYKKPSTIKKA